jgi:uncharacterized protein YhhL (DUF1145 family)
VYFEVLLGLVTGVALVIYLLVIINMAYPSPAQLLIMNCSEISILQQVIIPTFPLHENDPVLHITT